MGGKVCEAWRRMDVGRLKKSWVCGRSSKCEIGSLGGKEKK